MTLLFPPFMLIRAGGVYGANEGGNVSMGFMSQ
jgi:hypothetical protein